MRSFKMVTERLSALQKHSDIHTLHVQVLAPHTNKKSDTALRRIGFFI